MNQVQASAAVAAAACSYAWREEEKRAREIRLHPMSQRTHTCYGEPAAKKSVTDKSDNARDGGAHG